MTKIANSKKKFSLSREGDDSLYKIYMECEDLTEWAFADKHIDGGYPAWVKLLEDSATLQVVVEWRKELQLKLKYLALESLKEQSAKGHVQAAKFLVEKGYLTKEESKLEATDPTNQGLQNTRVMREKMHQDFKRLREIN